MDWATEIFSWFCGQGRCFEIDGRALPVCQRCLGLYIGAAVTGVWVLAGRGWRRGLPPKGLALVHIGLLLAALLGGLHVLDAEPRWRLFCGLATGHVCIAWLVGAGATLGRRGRVDVWRWGDRLAGWLIIGGFVLLAAMFEELKWLGWHIWTAAAAL